MLLGQVESFVRPEEKRLIVAVIKPRDQHRPANVRSIVIQVESRLCEAEWVGRIETLVLPVFETRAVKIVRSALGDRRDISNPSVFRAGIHLVYPDLFYGVKRGKEFGYRGGVERPDGADSVDGHLKHLGRGAHYRQVSVGVCLHPRLSGQGRHWAGRTLRPARDRDR